MHYHLISLCFHLICIAIFKYLIWNDIWIYLALFYSWCIICAICDARIPITWFTVIITTKITIFRLRLHNPMLVTLSQNIHFVFVITSVNAIWYLMPNHFCDCVSRNMAENKGERILRHWSLSMSFQLLYARLHRTGIISSELYYSCVSCLLRICATFVLNAHLFIVTCQVYL